MNEESVLIFGAGKIGRSFIGQLFGLAGYQVVFVDVDPDVVRELNIRKSYPVVIKGKTDEVIVVPNVRAVSGLDNSAVIHEISTASLMAISVGKNALEKIIPRIAEGLLLRNEKYPNWPLDIIIAENMRSAGIFIYNILSEILPKNYPIDNLVGLVETSIGKMVPIMTEEDLKEDPLLIFAEPYNTLILDKRGFKGPIPNVPGLSPKENIKAWVDRKAFIHNMGHASAAYFGNYFHPEANFIYEVLQDNKVFSATRNAMMQAANVLIRFYPGDFSLNDLELHVDDLISRFQNRALKDTVFRVGQDLPRKLGINDRFAGIIQMAMNAGIPYDFILKAMAFGFFFSKSDEQGNFNTQDVLFKNYLKEKGVENTVVSLCGFSQEKDRLLIDELKVEYLNLKQSGKKSI
jgi:mannitol-1-phosphate 5-dehydrogenase